MLATRAADASCALVYVNQVGGQDELVFDGGSMVFDADGELVARAPQFVEDVLVVDLDVEPGVPQAAARPPRPAHRRLLPDRRWSRPSRSSQPMADPSPPPAVAPAARPPTTRCTRRSCSAPATTCAKNGFTDVVIGLSGGIDSSLVAAIAVDALGAEHVHGVSMPSRYSQRPLR